MKTQGARARVVAESPAGTDAQNVRRPLLVFPGGAQLQSLHSATGLISRAWNWLRERQAARSNSKRLQVAASVSLGEKRFIAVIKVDGDQFLVGGSATNVALLAQLKADESFGNLLQGAIGTPEKPPAKRTRRRSAKPIAEQMGEQA